MTRKVFGGISPWLMREYMQIMGAEKISAEQDIYSLEGATISFAWTEPHRIASIVTKQLEVLVESPDKAFEEELAKRLELKAMRAGG